MSVVVTVAIIADWRRVVNIAGCTQTGSHAAADDDVIGLCDD